jgi:hypothetical protein
MPTLHRLATLRDDVIYFIALYQSWVYRVDYRRVNEFGQGGDDDEAAEKKEGDVDAAIEAKKDEAAATEVETSGADKKGGKKRR